MTPTQTAPWTAACATCGWTATAATYTAAGEACRAHDCPDPNTTVTPTDEDRDDDLGVTVDLDDLPGIPPLVRNARVLADVLFVDPPAAYMARATEYGAAIQGANVADLVAWCERHHLDEIEGWESGGLVWREFRGVIEGVPFEVTCEVPA